MGVVLFLAHVSLHLRHLAGSIGWRDAAELCSSAYNLGIAHPTGYPLYVLVGRCVCLVPLGDVPFRMALLSGFCQAFAALFVYRLLRRGRVSVPGAALSSLLFGGLSLFREKAVHCEVYPLFLLLLTVAIWALISRPGKPLWAFLLGAAATAHLTAVLVAPGILYLAWRKGALKRGPLRLLFSFLAGGSLVFFLPIRAQSEPLRLWVDLSSMGPFLQHITGAAYHHRMQGFTLARVFVQGRRLLQALAEIPALPLLLGPLALVDWFRSNRTLFVAVLLSSFPLLFFYLAYNTTDIADFAPHAFPLGLIACISAGAAFYRLDRSRAARWVKGCAFLCASLPFIISPTGSGRKDLSTDLFFTPAVRCLPRGGCLITSGDNTTFYLWYTRTVEHRRRDLYHVGLRAGRNIVEVSSNVPGGLGEELEGKPWTAAARRFLSARVPVFVEPGTQLPEGIASELYPRDGWWTAIPGSPYKDEMSSFRRRIDRMVVSRPILTVNRDFSFHVGSLVNAIASGIVAGGDREAATTHLQWATRVCPALPQLSYNLRYLQEQ